MSLEIWFAFVAASAALLAMPGPVVLLLFSYTLGHGAGRSWAAIPGVVLGDCAAMSVSLLGAGALLQASASLFTLLKIAGAGYLIWLGVRLWSARSARLDAGQRDLGQADARADRRSIFLQAFFVTALNPKDIVFFVAFLPQFIDPAKPVLAQIFVIEGTFLAMVLVSTSLWIFLSGRLCNGLKSPLALTWVQRVGGGSLIGAGLVTALGRQV